MIKVICDTMCATTESWDEQVQRIAKGAREMSAVFQTSCLRKLEDWMKPATGDAQRSEAFKSCTDQTAGWHARLDIAGNMNRRGRQGVGYSRWFDQQRIAIEVETRICWQRHA